MDERVRPHVERVWHYHHMNHELAKADVIMVLCSHDTIVAERGAQLFLDGWAPLLVFSGGLGGITKRLWTDPEANRFAGIAVAMGVPHDKILIENRSTNTGENVQFTRELLAARGLDPASFILVQKPYMERRTLATFGQRWPEVEVIVTSPQISFDDYPRPDISRDDVIHIMLGDLQRLAVYADKGWSTRQDLPADVQAAFERLVRAGYTRRLLPPG